MLRLPTFAAIHQERGKPRGADSGELVQRFRFIATSDADQIGHYSGGQTLALPIISGVTVQVVRHFPHRLPLERDPLALCTKRSSMVSATVRSDRRPC